MEDLEMEIVNMIIRYEDEDSCDVSTRDILKFMVRWAQSRLDRLESFDRLEELKEKHK